MRASKAQSDVHAYAAAIYLIRSLIHPVSLQHSEDYGESAARMRTFDAQPLLEDSDSLIFLMHKYTLIF